MTANLSSMAGTTLTLLADPAGPVHEQVAAEALGHGRFRLLSSPGLVLGVAAGDIVAIRDDGSPELVQASGNIAVQVFGDDATCDAVALLLRPLGGWLDGRIPDTMSVFTIPPSADLDRLEDLLWAVVDRHPDTEWLYGNLFEETGS
jgi:hypothetical protein